MAQVTAAGNHPQRVGDTRRGEETMNGKPLYCDPTCCGRQIMAIDFENRVTITAKHHGTHHRLIVYRLTDSREFIDEVQDRLAGSTN
jgi:hypothetical protein